jgi:hypothetical protein
MYDRGSKDPDLAYDGTPTAYDAGHEVALPPGSTHAWIVLMDAHEPAFLEIVLESRDFTFDGRDEVENPLHEALTAAGIGKVTGGGSGMGKSNIDVEVSDLEAGLALVRRVLRDLKVAASTVIYAQQGDQATRTGRITAYPVYQQP